MAVNPKNAPAGENDQMDLFGSEEGEEQDNPEVVSHSPERIHRDSELRSSSEERREEI